MYTISIRQQPIGFTNCLDRNDILDGYNGDIIENPDGTVSVYIPSINGDAPITLSMVCCEFLDPRYTFDIETQTCRWVPIVTTCSVSDTLKIILNPKGNDGTLFYVEENDKCTLNIDLDYLFKVKCETITDILRGGIKSIRNEKEDFVINDLQNQIKEQTVICQSITEKIQSISKGFGRVSHSVSCDSIPLQPQVLVTEPSKTISFGRTGFGSVAPFSFAVLDSLIAGQNYCLSEPDGLSAWHDILGNVNYNAFIQGDIKSFTCADVQILFNQNAVIVNDNIFNGTQKQELMFACDTPFGTKSALIQEIADLTQAQIKCQETLTSLTNQLTNLSIENGSSGCNTPLEMFETFDVSLTLDIVTSANTLQTIATIPLFPAIGNGNLYQYLTSNINSGFYVCGESPDGCVPLTLNLTGIPQTNTSSCDSVMNSIIEELFDESGLSGTSGANDVFINALPQTALASQWLHFSTGITDTTILNAIANQYIKLSLKINHACGDFCVLIDSIVLDKNCTHIERTDIFLTQSPGFELERIRDNKKSWINNTSLVNRPFVINNNKGGNSIRQTNYDVNDERLVINTKEIDLDINLAAAIETDVWCYLVDNPCLLTGITSCNPCTGEIIIPCGNKQFMDNQCYLFMDGNVYEFMDGMFTGGTGFTSVIGLNNSNCCGDNQIDFASLMTQPLSAITTIEDFQYFLTSELIDAKNRQTISGYPTLRALYDRYMNSGLYCGTNSSRFDYLTMDQFAGLVGNYWIDIVEQVIPATTIWGSVKVYTNTIFDQQKFKYKSYSSLLCGNPFNGQTVLSPINGINGQCTSVSVVSTPITIKNGDNLVLKSPITTYCDSLCIAQMNSGSEFIGTVSISGPAAPNCEIDGNSINEGIGLSVVITDYINISLNVIGATSPITYSWSNGDTGSTTTMTAGTYSVTVVDVNCNEATLEFDVPPVELTACWYSLPEKPEFVISRMVCGDEAPDYSAFTFSIVGVEINGNELIINTGYSTTITSGTTNFIPANNGVLSGCTFADPVGVTYTDFVDLINIAFVDLGLTNYSAQISTIEKPGGLNQGFYIIRPVSDVFTIKSSGSQNLKYTNNVINTWSDDEYTYYNVVCDDITLDNGVVIE